MGRWSVGPSFSRAKFDHVHNFMPRKSRYIGGSEANGVVRVAYILFGHVGQGEGTKIVLG